MELMVKWIGNASFRRPSNQMKIVIKINCTVVKNNPERTFLF